MALASYNGEDIVISQKLGKIYYISLKDLMIIKKFNIPKSCCVFRMLDKDIMIMGCSKRLFLLNIEEKKVKRPGGMLESQSKLRCLRVIKFLEREFDGDLKASSFKLS